MAASSGRVLVPVLAQIARRGGQVRLSTLAHPKSRWQNSSSLPKSLRNKLTPSELNLKAEPIGSAFTSSFRLSSLEVEVESCCTVQCTQYSVPLRSISSVYQYHYQSVPVEYYYH